MILSRGATGSQLHFGELQLWQQCRGGREGVMSIEGLLPQPRQVMVKVRTGVVGERGTNPQASGQGESGASWLG